jgi:Helix-turn-helix domain
MWSAFRTGSSAQDVQLDVRGGARAASMGSGQAAALMGARLLVVDGQVVAALEGEVAALVAEVCERANAQQVRVGKVPPILGDVIAKLRAASAVAALRSANGTNVAAGAGGSSSSSVMSTTEASEVLDLSDREIRNRCVSGELVGARQLGRAWMIPRTSVLAALEEGA